MNSEVIITADFNIDLLKIADQEVLVEYFDMLTAIVSFLKSHFRLDYLINMALL